MTAREAQEVARTEYELVRDAVLESFNPPDDDAAEPSIMADAIEAAAAFIADQPCSCDRTHSDKYWEEPCHRCRVLGRVRDEVEAR